MDDSGTVKHFSSSDRSSLIKNVIETMASNGLRTIALAYRDFPANSELDWETENTIVTNLTCIGITGIEDPVRPEVIDYASLIFGICWLSTLNFIHI